MENLKQALVFPVLRALLDAAPDATLIVDAEGRIAYANSQLGTVFGVAVEELIGGTMDVLVPERFRSVHGAHLARYFNNPQRRLMGSHRGVFFGFRPDGTEFPAEISLSPLTFDSVTYGIASIRDITERVEMEQALKRAAVQEQIIKAQAARLRELSMPLIPVSDGVVVMPLIGLLDEARAAQLQEVLLEGVAEACARVAILDVTGVPEMDASAARALLSGVSAARLLGAEVVLTGIKPAAAQALVALGADFGQVVTRGTLKDGIRYALAKGL